MSDDTRHANKAITHGQIFKLLNIPNGLGSLNICLRLDRCLRLWRVLPSGLLSFYVFGCLYITMGYSTQYIMVVLNHSTDFFFVLSPRSFVPSAFVFVVLFFLCLSLSFFSFLCLSPCLFCLCPLSLTTTGLIYPFSFQSISLL